MRIHRKIGNMANRAGGNSLLDCGNPMFTADYAFRDVYLLCTAAEDAEHVWQRAKSGLEGWIACFPKARRAGCVFGGGATAVGTVREKPARKEAWEMGKQV